MYRKTRPDQCYGERKTGSTEKKTERGSAGSLGFDSQRFSLLRCCLSGSSKRLACSLLVLCLLVGGCAGTGTMYNPEKDVDSDDFEYEAGEGASAEGSTAELSQTALSGEASYSDPQQEEPGEETDSRRAGRKEGRRISTAYLEGTGSDLFTRATIDYYYKFVLEGVSLQLPCSASDLMNAGWEIVVPEEQISVPEEVSPGRADDGDDPAAVQSEGEGEAFPEVETVSGLSEAAVIDGEGAAAQENPAEASNEGAETVSRRARIAPLSYEFFDAVPVGTAAEKEENADNFGNSLNQTEKSQRRIRVCLANPETISMDPVDCTLCGISASKDSGVSLTTVFGNGFGDTLDDLFSIFGRDPSFYQLTEYGDGVRTLRFTFSNGLIEEERIPVLPEAEEKSLAEQLLARTDADGETITELSFYYFRLPDVPGENRAEPRE